MQGLGLPIGRVLNAAALRRAFTNPASIVAITVVLQNVLRIASSVILTRLLSADVYGVIGIVTSVSVAFALLSDIGIIAFVVRHPNADDPTFLDELWTIRLVRSAALSAGMAVVAWPLAHALGKPEMALPIAVGGLFFIFDGISSMAFITALRNKQVGLLSLIDLIAQCVGLFISIGLAWWLRNYWAILLANFLSQLLKAALSYMLFEGSARRLRFSGERMRELWTFARFITGSTILTLALTQADKFLLSGMMSLENFGLYMIASNLAMTPVGLAQAYAARVLYPVYAQIYNQRPAELTRAFYAERRIPSLLYAMGVGGLIALAPACIQLLFDPRYLGAIPYFQLLAAGALFALGNYSVNELMIARGFTRFTLQTNMVRIAYLLVAGPALFVTMGPIGLIVALGFMELVAQLYGWWELRRIGALNIAMEGSFLVAAALGFGLGWLLLPLARMMMPV